MVRATTCVPPLLEELLDELLLEELLLEELLLEGSSPDDPPPPPHPFPMRNSATARLARRAMTHLSLRMLIDASFSR
jgi:hypothetical protein